MVCLALFSVPSILAQGTTPANFKIAFIGDQGRGENPTKVLKLIRDEKADAVLHAGDFDYTYSPWAWEDQINSVLGPDFPYFALPGNHDTSNFYGQSGYQSYMQARMNRLGIPWHGDLGVMSSFTYQGIFFVLTAPAVFGTGHAAYIRDQLAGTEAIWRISSWHKNMRNMQVGNKTDETGWEVYEESRRGGAIVATGHEHSYSRTHLLSSCENQWVASTSDTLVLTKDLPETQDDEGKTFVFVSGIAGATIREQKRTGDWWASIYSATQGANFGALFGIFNVDGNTNKAKFYFKDITGAIPDSFIVISQVVAKIQLSDVSEAPASPASFSLSQNYPNPFNPETEIRFNLSENTPVQLQIFSTLGRTIRTLIDGQYGAGEHSIQWDGRDDQGNPAPSGMYLYRLTTPGAFQVKKMTLMR